MAIGITMNSQKRFAAIGECMIEMSQAAELNYNMKFAGDTLTACVYLARCSDFDNVEVSYITALGDDPYSQMMLKNWQDEDIVTDAVRILPTKLPGLYFIDTDEQGERTFHYYRSQAAAKDMFKSEAGEALCHQLLDYDYLYLSGISLAILDSKLRY